MKTSVETEPTAASKSLVVDVSKSIVFFAKIIDKNDL